jgi:hypothetical protein
MNIIDKFVLRRLEREIRCQMSEDMYLTACEMRDAARTSRNPSERARFYRIALEIYSNGFPHDEHPDWALGLTPKEMRQSRFYCK